MEISLMLIHPPLAAQAQPEESSPQTIHPIEVWTTLTLTQQHTFLQTLVMMCQDCLLPGKEVGHDSASPLAENHFNPS
jgi:hypothetical protein